MNDDINEEVNNEKQENKDDGVLAYLAFGMLPSGDVDIRVVWPEESQLTATALANLLVQVNLGMFQADIFKILSDKTLEGEDMQVFVDEVVRQWTTKYKLIKGGKNTIKPSQVFRSIKGIGSEL